MKSVGSCIASPSPAIVRSERLRETQNSTIATRSPGSQPLTELQKIRSPSAPCVNVFTEAPIPPRDVRFYRNRARRCPESSTTCRLVLGASTSGRLGSSQRLWGAGDAREGRAHGPVHRSGAAPRNTRRARGRTRILTSIDSRPALGTRRHPVCGVRINARPGLAIVPLPARRRAAPQIPWARR